MVNCTVTEPTCYGENGTVLVEATGTGATTGTGTFSVPAGEYYIFNVNRCKRLYQRLHRTDQSACESRSAFHFLHLRIVVVQTGTATVKVATGGTGSYTYLWSQADKRARRLLGLTAGMYTVQIPLTAPAAVALLPSR